MQTPHNREPLSNDPASGDVNSAEYRSALLALLQSAQERREQSARHSMTLGDSVLMLEAFQLLQRSGPGQALNRIEAELASLRDGLDDATLGEPRPSARAWLDHAPSAGPGTEHRRVSRLGICAPARQ